MYEVKKEISIFCSPNAYGYRLNVNHPKINELYRRYKRWKGLASDFPLSDSERFEFERYVMPLIKSKENIPPVKL